MTIIEQLGYFLGCVSAPRMHDRCTRRGEESLRRQVHTKRRGEPSPTGAHEEARRAFADRCTRRGEESLRHRSLAPGRYLSILSRRQRGMKSRSSILNPNSNGSRWNRVMRNANGRRNSTACRRWEESWLRSFGMRQLLFF